MFVEDEVYLPPLDCLRASPMASLEPQYHTLALARSRAQRFAALQRRSRLLAIVRGPPAAHHLARHSGRAT